MIKTRSVCFFSFLCSSVLSSSCGSRVIALNVQEGDSGVSNGGSTPGSKPDDVDSGEPFIDDTMRAPPADIQLTKNPFDEQWDNYDFPAVGDVGHCGRGTLERVPSESLSHYFAVHIALKSPSTYNFGLVMRLDVDRSTTALPNGVVHLVGTMMSDQKLSGDRCMGMCELPRMNCVLNDCKTNGANMQRPTWFSSYVWNDWLPYNSTATAWACVSEQEKTWTIELLGFDYRQEAHPNIAVDNVRLGVLLTKDSRGAYGTGVIRLDRVILEGQLLTSRNGNTTGEGLVSMMELPADSPIIAPRGGKTIPQATFEDSIQLAACRNADGGVCQGPGL